MPISIDEIITIRFAMAEGNQFQKIFFEIMKAVHGLNFTMPKNHGDFGDYKCDGILIDEGTYFAVYSPENPNINDEKQYYAISKYRKDIKGFISKYNEEIWGYQLKKFVIVYNGKYNEKIPAPILSEISKLDKEIKKDFPEVNVLPMTQYDLKIEFLKLDSKLQQFILNRTYGSEQEINLDGAIISLMLSEMHKQNFKRVMPHQLMEFNEKIIFNGIDEERALDLKQASMNIQDFKIFTRKYNTTYINILQDQCINLYNEAFLSHPDDSNFQFDYILNNLYHNSSEKDYSLLREIKRNKLIIMATYFENCSIFKSKETSK